MSLSQSPRAASAAPGADGRRPIRQLPELVAAQIAAGEVIERPAAVLKELLENALDAGARRISVQITGAGQECIAVHDDGCGIARADAALAFRRHATSKLGAVEDLERLESYGFRGEALPAIAAAAGRLRLVTRTAQSDAAVQIEFEQGRAGPVRPAARAAGTSIEVWELFAGQPARRAFQAGARAERAALTRAAADAVLARPGRSLRLEIDGRRPLEHAAARGLSPESALREAAGAVFSRAAAERALWFTARSERAELRLDGLAGAPEDARRSRERIRLFVNGRPVHDRRLAYAVGEAYRDWLGAGQFPLCVLRLSAPPAAVDVNIHPAKTEVKLRDQDAAFSLVQRAIRRALSEAAAPPRLEAGLEFADDEAVISAAGGRRALPQPRRLGRSVRSGGARSQALAEPALASAFEPGARAAALPPLRVLGQWQRTFIIAEGPAGLILVDQHAAHERVVYERLLAADGAGAARQPLLEPITIELDAEQASHWERAAAELSELGVEAEAWGERGLRLSALPAAAAAAQPEAFVRGILEDLIGGREVPERFDRAAASAACHGSVRRGQVLDTAAMSALLRDLERCQQPHTCPHGRPTLVEIDSDDVLRRFGRL